MHIDTLKTLIFSDNPSVIEWMVLQKIEEGYSLSANPYVMNGQFCQWMTRRDSVFEVKLVSAVFPSEFESIVRMMNTKGFELALEPVTWNGMVFQWMARILPSEKNGLYIGEWKSSESVTPLLDAVDAWWKLRRN